MDGPPAQSLGVEPVEEDVVRQRARDTKEPMITKRLIVNVLLSALFIIGGTLWVFQKEVSYLYLSSSRIIKKLFYFHCS